MVPIIDYMSLANWIFSKLNATKINMFTSFVMKQGKSYWMNFKSWLWGLNCDIHEALVRKILPVMPVVEDSFDMLEARVEMLADTENLTECLELDYSNNSEFNETWVEKNETDDNSNRRSKLKALRKQRHKIKEGFMGRAVLAVEIMLRTKHGLVPGNELNEHALRMSAQEICRDHSINPLDTYFLTQAPVMKAMIPDQRQMDALRVIYNGESAARRSTVEALRNSEAYSHFKSGHYA
jgi:hypothetical protein